MIQDVLSCGCSPPSKGRYLMDAPAAGGENTTALVAGGANVILFTTGQGNPLGSPLAPTIKITGNKNTAIRYQENMDVDLSYVIENDISIDEAGADLYQELKRVCNGKLTSAEVLGMGEISVTRVDFTL